MRELATVVEELCLVRDANQRARRVEQIDDEKRQDDCEHARLQRAGDVEGQQCWRWIGRQRGDALPLGDAQDEAGGGHAQHPDERGARHPAGGERDDHAKAEQ